jgi:hypothetical protein
MTKADYVKNTQLSGIHPEVLEVRETVLLLTRRFQLFPLVLL